MPTRTQRARRASRARSKIPRKEPVQARSRATVDDILEAAAQVFESSGFAGGTTNRIAKRAGVSIGTVYQYFPDKHALVLALLERHLQEGTRCLSEWAERCRVDDLSLHQALEHLVRGLIELHANRPRLQHILLEEVPPPESIHADVLRYEAAAVQTVRAELSRHRECSGRDLECVAMLTVQTVERLTHHLAAHPAQVPARCQLERELVTMLESYLSSANTHTGLPALSCTERGPSEDTA